MGFRIAFIAIAGVLLLGPSPARALAIDTRCDQANLLGIADDVDAGNAVKTDDALVCMGQHTLNSFVPGQPSFPLTFAQWEQEAANTGAHELAHLFGIRHEDDSCSGPGDAAFIGCDLMNGPYDGVAKVLTAEALARLDALAAETQVVWLDFEAASPELPAGLYTGIRTHPLMAAMTVADQDLAIAIISAALQGKYSTGTTTGYANGFKLSFTTTQPGAGSYSTVSFVVPEPGTLLLLGLGIAWLAARRGGVRA
jgi:hypothetical protein